MKNLSPQIWRTFIAFLIISGVIVLALAGYLGPALKVATDPLITAQEWLSGRYQTFVEFLTVPRDVAAVRLRNTELENKVSSLEIQIVQLQQQLSESQVLYALLDFARARPQNQYVAAAVIGRDPSPFLQYVFLDKGSDDGIRHGMPVVTQQGLVGRIDAVTAGGARVRLISDASSAVNVRLKSSQKEAQIKGSVTGEVTLEMVPQDVNLQPGELVLTSGLGGNYPQDIVVGQVVSVRKRTNELFQSAAIQTAADLTNLRAVLIITNFKPVDIQPLVPTAVR